MKIRKMMTGVLALALALFLGCLPAVESSAKQGKGGGEGKQASAAQQRNKNRSSVSQSRGHQGPSASKKHYQRPPHARPPSYRPPHHRPPHYRPRPPRYRGRYYRDYAAYHAMVGLAMGIAIGVILGSPPPQAHTVVIKETTYYVHDGVYYEPVLYEGGTAYQVVPAP